MEPGRERRLVTAAILLGMFLAALEATAVATAMPTAVSDLGSVERYSWAFSAYLLTSTTTVPMFGKLSDLYGRRRVYLVATAIFLIGSALCGAAGSMEQLIAFRALQGIGAGGVTPVAITIIGDIFTLQERGRIQGLFSGVWAVASVLGPALGGFITDLMHWRWVFYINIPFGVLSAAMLMLYLREEPGRREHKLDILGTVLLTLGVGTLLVGVQEGTTLWGWVWWPTGALIAAGLALLAAFVRQEARAPEPMLPLDLFRSRVIATASGGAVVMGLVLFPVTAFVPMYAQGVLGGSATAAGAALMPMLLGWPLASTIAGMLIMRVGYRPLAITGGVLAGIGGVLLAQVSPAGPPWLLGAAVGVIGLGMGFLSTPYIVAVQAAVPWRRRGVATSSQQFFRTIGGAIAVAVFGAMLNAELAASGTADLARDVLDPERRRLVAPDVLARISDTLAVGLHHIYVGIAIVAATALLIALLFPRGGADEHQHRDDAAPEPVVSG